MAYTSCQSVNFKFHWTDTDTDTDTDFLADFRARPVQLATSRTRTTCPRTFVRHARFSSRGYPLGMRACTHVAYECILYYAIVYTFTKLHERRIPKVGVSPVEFKLNWTTPAYANRR